MSEEKTSLVPDQMLQSIMNFYNVSEECADYLYTRASRSKRKGLKYMPWNIQLQNAIVKADKCLGLEWDKLQFGQEAETLKYRGIIVNEMPIIIFKWNKNCTLNEEELNEWTTVINKKNKKKNRNNIIESCGLIIKL